MRFSFSVRVRRLVDQTMVRLAMATRKLWLTVALTGIEAAHRLAVVPRDFLRTTSKRRLVLLVGLAALVLTPSVLYLVERSHRLARERSYEALTFSTATETGFLRASMSNLLADRARLTDILLEAGYPIRTGDRTLVKVVATGYSSSIYETDSTPFITAANTQTRDGILALSRDLLKRYTPGAPFDFGDRVHVAGLGEFIVEDSMNSRWNNRIDLWFPSRLGALRFGVREVYLQTVNEDLQLPDELSEKDPETSVSGL